MLDIELYKKAGYFCVAINAPEDLKIVGADVISLFSENALIDGRATKIDDAIDTLRVLSKSEGIAVVLDSRHNIGNAMFYRALLDIREDCEVNGRLIVLSNPTIDLPLELRTSIPVVTKPLPEKQDYIDMLDRVVPDDILVGLTGEETEKIAVALKGMTIKAAENSLALSLVKNRCINIDDIYLEKIASINKMPGLSVKMPDKTSKIGGYELFVEYITKQIIPNMDKADLRVKGLLLTGLSGSGKTLSSKIVSNITNLPMFELNISKIKGGVVGETEANVQNAIDIIQSFGDCVVLLNEVDKAIGGVASSAQTDGGTLLNALGILLEWMESQSNAIVLCTCNDFSKLPQEFTRAGRLDAMFFFDLPNSDERSKILDIYIDKYGLDVDKKTFEDCVIDFVGAEIEQFVKVFARTGDLKIAKDTVKPKALSMPEYIDTMRKQAYGRFLPASISDVKAKLRKISV